MGPLGLLSSISVVVTVWLLQEQVDRCDQNVDDHEDYQHRMRACDDWLKNAHLQLNEMKDKPADQETLQAKLQAVEVRQSHLFCDSLTNIVNMVIYSQHSENEFTIIIIIFIAK